MMWRLIALFLAIIAAPAFAQQQGGIVSSGPITPGHTLRTLAPLGKNGAVVGDGGGAGGTSVQGQNTLTEIGITNTGTPFCIHTDLITGNDKPLCLGHDANNNPIFTSNGVGFPLAGNGNVSGPNPSTAGHIAVFGNSVGSLLSDPSAFPATFGSTPTEIAAINVGGYPTASKITAGVATGLTSAMLVPNTYTQAPQPNAAIAGYIENNNSANGNSAVAVYGFAQTNTNGASPYGGNFTASNYRLPYTTNGNDFGFAIGEEIDVSIGKKAGNVTPSGIMRALNIVNFSNVDPTGGSTAIWIQASSGVAFDTGIQTTDGATVTAFQAGASGTGNGVGSQPISLVSRTAGGTIQFTNLVADAAGNLSVSLPTSAAFVPAGHYAAGNRGAVAPVITGCGSGAAFSGGGTDAAGTVIPGTGSPAGCTITFRDQFAAPPKCIANSGDTTTRVVLGTSASQLIATFVGGTPVNFTYWCVQ